MKNSDYELAYRVEIEFVLIFHQKLIFAQREHNAGNPTICNNDTTIDQAQIDAYLEKNLTPEVRMQMNPAPQAYHQTRPQYLAWGIRVGAYEAPELTAATYSTDGTLRTYKHEHLHIAREVLRSADQNERLQYWDSSVPSDTTIDVRPAKPTTFNNWHLIKALAIEALTQTELEHYLKTYKMCFERDGFTSTKRTKRSLSPDASSAGGSAPKKLKLTQSPLGISSSFQSNVTNENNTPFQDPFQEGANPFLTSLKRFPLGPELLPQGPNLDDDPTESFEDVMKLLQPFNTPTGRPDPGIPVLIAMQQRYTVNQKHRITPYDSDPKSHFFGMVDFYDPIIRGRDPRSYTLDDILNWRDDRIERDKDCFLTLFPLPQGGGGYHAFRPTPRVDEATFVAFNTRQDLRAQLLRSLDRIWQLFGFQRVQQSSVIRGREYSYATERFRKAWESHHDQVSRIVRCLRILGLPRETFYFYYTIVRAIHVSDKTRKLWLEAAVGPLYVKLKPHDGNNYRPDMSDSHPFLRPDYTTLPKVPASSTVAGPSNAAPPNSRPGGQQTTTSATGTRPSNAPPSHTTLPGGQQTTTSATSVQPNLSAVTAARTTGSEPQARLPETSECKYNMQENFWL